MSSLPDMLAHLNSSLDVMGEDIEIGAEVEVPVRFQYGPIEIETHIEIEVTEDGYRIIDLERQRQRIKTEMQDSLDGGGDYE